MVNGGLRMVKRLGLLGDAPLPATLWPADRLACRQAAYLPIGLRAISAAMACARAYSVRAVHPQPFIYHQRTFAHVHAHHRLRDFGVPMQNRLYDREVLDVAGEERLAAIRGEVLRLTHDGTQSIEEGVEVGIVRRANDEAMQLFVR